ncbi:MAG: competence/damage-inducible protein A [Balneolaceae bacterium]|nr:competence/damage-inducible protein A [Balneolaceae bacterium]
MKCQIISIGNELLIGDTTNTNASWMGTFLTSNEVEVTRVHTIGDDLSLLKSVIEQSMSEADLVITTGGLGPTHDDITKKAVADLFDVGMKVHQPTLDFIKKIFEQRGLTFSKSNYAQAEIPENAEVLFNKQGTAPGMWFEEFGSRLAVLPGVPYEMKALMEQQILPKIEKIVQGNSKRFSRYILTAGVGESNLSDKVVGDLSKFLDEQISVAYLPSPLGNRIRISASGSSVEEVEAYIDEVATYIHKKASKVIVGEGKDLTLAEGLGNLLKDKGLTIAVAESCTGGLLSDIITNVPGCSDYMMGGVIAYSNKAKMDLLGVDERSLKDHGAVSKRVALEMAKGAAEKFNTDIGVSTTGIAGPSGGTEVKPVGTVWIGYWSEDRHFALKALFTNDRLINKERSVSVALEMVRRTLTNVKTMPYGLKPHLA